MFLSSSSEEPPQHCNTENRVQTIEDRGDNIFTNRAFRCMMERHSFGWGVPYDDQLNSILECQQRERPPENVHCGLSGPEHRPQQSDDDIDRRLICLGSEENFAARSDRKRAINRAGIDSSHTPATPQPVSYPSDRFIYDPPSTARVPPPAPLPAHRPLPKFPSVTANGSLSLWSSATASSHPDQTTYTKGQWYGEHTGTGIPVHLSGHQHPLSPAPIERDGTQRPYIKQEHTILWAPPDQGIYPEFNSEGQFFPGQSLSTRLGELSHQWTTFQGGSPPNKLPWPHLDQARFSQPNHVERLYQSPTLPVGVDIAHSGWTSDFTSHNSYSEESQVEKWAVPSRDQHRVFKPAKPGGKSRGAPKKMKGKFPKLLPVPKPRSKPIQATLSKAHGMKVKDFASMLANPSLMSKPSPEVFNEYQHSKILWIVLHGIPSRGAARVLNPEIGCPQGVSSAKHLSNLEKVIDHLIAKVGQSKEDPDILISRLLQLGDSNNWSPYLLIHASEYADTTEKGNHNSRKKEREQAAAERQALTKWKVKHGGADPVQCGSRFPSREEALAIQGLRREKVDRERIETLGYREGSHEIERVIMKKCLLKIRELGELPDRLDERDGEIDRDETEDEGDIGGTPRRPYDPDETEGKEDVGQAFGLAYVPDETEEKEEEVRW